MHIFPLAALLFQVAGGTGGVEVRLRDGEVWIEKGRSGSAQTQLTKDGRSKYGALLSPDKSKIVYWQACPQPEHCEPELIILDLDGKRLQAFAPTMPVNGGLCVSSGDVEWIDNNRVGLDCHINPSLGEYLDIDAGSARTTQSFLGFWFTRSPDRKRLAYAGWIPHFAPPYAKSNYLQIDGKTVYPLPAPSKDLTLQVGRLFTGIHEFMHPLVWSADSSWLPSSKTCTTGSPTVAIRAGKTCITTTFWWSPGRRHRWWQQYRKDPAR